MAVVLLYFLILLILIFVIVINNYKKKKKKEKILKEMFDVYWKIRNKWNKMSHESKMRSSSTYRDKGILVYKFLYDASEFYLIDDTIVNKMKIKGKPMYKNIKYTLNDTLSDLFKDFANETINYVNTHKRQEQRKQQKQQQNSNYYSWQQRNQQKQQKQQKQQNSNSGQQRKQQQNNTYSSKKASTNNKNETHPKWNLYQVLIKTASSRKEQLLKIPKNDPSRYNLENELKATEGRIKIFKEKYKF